MSPLLPTATAILPEVAIKAQEDMLNSQFSMLTEERILQYINILSLFFFLPFFVHGLFYG